MVPSLSRFLVVDYDRTLMLGIVPVIISIFYESNFSLYLDKLPVFIMCLKVSLDPPERSNSPPEKSFITV